MNIQKIVESFEKFIKQDVIIAIGTCEADADFIDELIKLLLFKKKKILFVPTTAKQATQLHNLGQTVISLSDKEIDVAIEFANQVDSYNNFIKKDTRSFIRDKMIAQSAQTMVIVTNSYDIVEKIDKDIYVEISSFAWERTILNLQSYGFARVVKDTDDNFTKTETGHYLARITLDKNITLDDFEYSVRTIPGVLETGVFLGLADIFLVIDSKEQITIKTTSQVKQ
ncbi:MAG: ribose-5-phosphate isomerase A [archaeon]|jgi:ribose 5-phosphate isomerase A